MLIVRLTHILSTAIVVAVSLPARGQPAGSGLVWLLLERGEEGGSDDGGWESGKRGHDTFLIPKRVNIS